MSEVTEAPEGIGPLNLSDADTTIPSFEVIPSGTEVKSEVFEADWTKIKADSTGKLAPGTRGLKVHIKVLNDGEGSKYYNRRVFNNFWLPGPEYEDQEKAKKMRGMLVNFLVAIGYEKDAVMGGSFDLDAEVEAGNLEGREFIMRVGVQKAQTDNEGNVIYPAQNTLFVAKHLSEGASVSETSGLL